jgi:hypothetical protein
VNQASLQPAANFIQRPSAVLKAANWDCSKDASNNQVAIMAPPDWRETSLSNGSGVDKP